jgi:hypothetical protein
MAVVVRKWKMRICGDWMVNWAYTGSWASVRCRGDDVMSAVRLPLSDGPDGASGSRYLRALPCPSRAITILGAESQM